MYKKDRSISKAIASFILVGIMVFSLFSSMNINNFKAKSFNSEESSIKLDISDGDILISGNDDNTALNIFINKKLVHENVTFSSEITITGKTKTNHIDIDAPSTMVDGPININLLNLTVYIQEDESPEADALNIKDSAVNIKFSGNNYLITKSPCSGICSHGSTLNLSGDGVLEVVGQQAILNLYGNINFLGGTYKTRALMDAIMNFGDSSENTGNITISDGVNANFAGGFYSMQNFGGTFKINGGNLNIYGEDGFLNSSNPYNLRTGKFYISGGDISINRVRYQGLSNVKGSEFFITGGNISIKAGVYGILNSDQSKFFIQNAEVNVTAKGETGPITTQGILNIDGASFNVIDNSVLNTYGVSYGVYNKGANFIVSDSKINASGNVSGVLSEGQSNENQIYITTHVNNIILNDQKRLMEYEDYLSSLGYKIAESVQDEKKANDFMPLFEVVRGVVDSKSLSTCGVGDTKFCGINIDGGKVNLIDATIEADGPDYGIYLNYGVSLFAAASSDSALQSNSKDFYGNYFIHHSFEEPVPADADICLTKSDENRLTIYRLPKGCKTYAFNLRSSGDYMINIREGDEMLSSTVVSKDSGSCVFNINDMTDVPVASSVLRQAV